MWTNRQKTWEVNQTLQLKLIMQNSNSSLSSKLMAVHWWCKFQESRSELTARMTTREMQMPIQFSGPQLILRESKKLWNLETLMFMHRPKIISNRLRVECMGKLQCTAHNRDSRHITSSTLIISKWWFLLRWMISVQFLRLNRLIWSDKSLTKTLVEL